LVALVVDDSQGRLKDEEFALAALDDLETLEQVSVLAVERFVLQLLLLSGMGMVEH